ncbi:Protein kinase protein rad53 [Taxawa tesnikishii (nom. ined.)]|nr:Protein kinase protein rad53 [Dothideales sp. JES 119]
MEGQDAILVLTAVSSTAEAAFGLPHNTCRYSPPSFGHGFDSRESTPLPNLQEDDDDANCRHRLRLTFTQPPQDIQKGYVFGTDRRRCDVLLGQRRGQGSISGEHFSITFNDDGRVILRDFSRCGTAVSYDAFEEIEVQLSGTDFKFWIELARHKECQTEYQANVSAFTKERRVLRESTSTLPPFSTLDIQSQSTTAAPTTSHSPGQGPVYLVYEELGRGEFGTVHKVVDVSTGYVYAGKEFMRPGWENEVAAMRRVSHQRIIRFVDFRPEPNPLLVMEYLPLGNLQDQHENVPIAVEDAVALLYQVLQGVGYLHSQCLAHRDIKPANILVESRSPFSIKLADFGLVKDMSALQTCCGTALYAAPEIWKGSGYTSAVDIWSLGLVVFEFVYGLPKLKRGPFRARDWCDRVVKAVEDWDSDELVDCLSTRMLRLDPKQRSSADDCLKQAAEIHRSYQVMLYMPYQRAECTTPTEKMSTFRTDLHGLNTFEQCTQLDTAHVSRSCRSSHSRSRKRQRHDIVKTNAQERLSDQQVPAEMSFGKNQRSVSPRGISHSRSSRPTGYG